MCMIPTTINKGAPQEYMLFAFLFILYANALSLSSQSFKILEYADDTVIVDLIFHPDEQEYTNTIFCTINWCEKNYLCINVTKAKEMIFDKRKKMGWMGSDIQHNLVQIPEYVCAKRCKTLIPKII